MQKAIKETRVNPEALRAHLTSSSQWTVAEPLYIALALDGHPDPYETSRRLVDKARAQGVGLLTLLSTDPEAKTILDGVTADHRRAILDPTEYLGDAESRTETTCGFWAARLKPEILTVALNRPDEDSALVHPAIYPEVTVHAAGSRS